MTDYVPQCGDDLVSTNDSDFGRITKWTSRGRGEAPTIATHLGKFLDAENTVEAFMSLGCVGKHNWIKRQADMVISGHEWCILTRVEPLGEYSLSRMRCHISESIGWTYSKAELILQLADGICGKFTKKPFLFFRKLGDIVMNSVICSKTSNRSDIKLNLLPKYMEYADPDETYDYKIKSGKYHIAACSSGWPKGE